MEKLSSCIQKEPFVKLDENGSASILNYNLPQSTCYNAVSYLGLTINPKLFKANERRKPRPDYWEKFEDLQKEQIKIELEKEPSLIKDFEVLNRATAINFEAAPAQVEADNADFKLRRATSSPAPVENPDLEYVAERMAQGLMPVAYRRFSGKPRFLFIPKPPRANPQISIVLHLKMCSYLGDYGAGQTLKTLSLLPGERTTITISHYLRNETTRRQAESILDSYSESSADELQNTVERESQFATGSSSSETYSKTGNWNAGGSVGLNLGFLSVGGGGGGGGSSTSSSTLNSNLSTQVNNLNSSVSHHVSTADSMRQIDINTESNTSSITETEEVIVREFENINKSRVLNFVFRQLLQEYFSVTYLDDVSIIYYNGFPKSKRTVKLSQIDDLLNDVFINDAAVQQIKNQIFGYLCSIYDYKGDKVSFIEKVEEEIENCIDPEQPIQKFFYVRKRKDLEQTYKNRKFNGIILNVSHRIIRTPSLIVDALLGQGEALDCYNMKLQNEATINAHLDNKKLRQAIELIENITDPIEKAKLYKKVFGDCCDVPQSGCGCFGQKMEE